MLRRYLKKFFIRLIIVSIVIYLYIFYPEQIDIHANIFYDGIKFIHILWLYLFINSVTQLIPRRNIILGLGKQFSKNFVESNKNISKEVLDIKSDIKKMNIQALKVLFVWLIANSIISLLYILGYLKAADMLIISMIYFLGDVVCVVFFCPFQRFIMKNRCCTVCRIFNWDHIMMYTPFVFVKGFFTRSLLFMGIIVLVRWEYSFAKYPERFVESSNDALKCSNCKDYICKIRKPLYNGLKTKKD